MVIYELEGFHYVNIQIIYLSLAHDQGWPQPGGRGLQHDPGVDGRAEDVVEVVDDAGEEGDHEHGQDESPDATPTPTMREGVMVEPVGGRPQRES